MNKILNKYNPIYVNCCFNENLTKFVKIPKKKAKNTIFFNQSQDMFSNLRFRTYHFILHVLYQDNDGQKHDETFVSNQELLNQILHSDTTTEVARRTLSASRPYES